ncbi:MAG TPA: PBP1A family penicillin-binding protein [Candidatus Bathyarchaeia archaeon]|nr:PBP1A family penicillin-binding protein [Candidatus Bathyarchaeia archaeon]
MKRTGPANGGIAKLVKIFFNLAGFILEIIGRPVLWLLFELWLLLIRFLLMLKVSCLFVFKTITGLIQLVFDLIIQLFLFALDLVTSLFSGLGKIILSLNPKARPCSVQPEIKPKQHLSLKLRLTKLGWKFFLFLLILTVLAGSGYWGYTIILKDLPQPDRLVTRSQVVSTKIFDRTGRLLYKIYRNQNRSLVKIEDIPPYLIQTTVAIEDAEFYQHYGFSPRGILRSLAKNLAEGKLQGGSTITQQLVKNALLSSERTLIRKIKELVLSIQTEMRFNKEEILQMYLNEVGYGGAAYGAEEAAWKYFGKSVRDLNLAESALLAGLPASPTLYSPFGAHPEMAKKRQIQVLQRMIAENFITPEEAEVAKATELQFAPQETNIYAPHFTMYVKDLLVRRFGEQLVEEGGLEVITSLDLEIQNFAQKVVSEELENLKKLSVTNGAVLITNPKTGEILAMVGSKNFFDTEHDGNVNVTLRPRQPGSAIKPVNYAVALGLGYTPATILSDTPITYKIPGQPPYSPRNYDNRFHGNISLRTALASSYNVPAVKILSSYGVNKMIEMGKKLGITTWNNEDRFGLSLTLGGGEVKMIDLAVVYGTLANSGQQINLNPILQVSDYRGKLYSGNECAQESSDSPDAPAAEAVKEKICQPKQVLNPQTTYLINDILTDNQARTPAFGSHSLLVIPDKTIAVKTGTTNSLRDNWTIGYTPDILVAAWVGNNDNSPMSYIASGLTGASSIWNKIMTTLIADKEDTPFSRPEGIIETKICPLTGTLPCLGCPVKTEIFTAGTEPKNHCFLKPTEDEEKTEREKILGTEDEKIIFPQPAIVDYQPPKEGEVVWEIISR